MNNGNISQLEMALIQKLPHKKTFIKTVFNQCNDDLMLFLDRYVSLVRLQGYTIDYIADCYVFFLKQTMKEQMWFARHKAYRYSSHDEVINMVYANSDYMEQYMIGLAISTVLWNNHRSLYEYYKSFISDRDCNGNYIEIGPGHGIFFREAVLSNIFDTCTAVDISATSLQLTRNMVADISGATQVKYFNADWMMFSSQYKYDVVVIGEVLEHVEKPQMFLEKCNELLTDDGRVYISTCANAPEPDHIFLFKSSNDVEDMINGSGLRIQDKMVLPYGDFSVDECVDMQLPMNMAYICKK